MNSTRVATAAPNSATPFTVCNALSAVLIIPFLGFSAYCFSFYHL